MTINTMKTCVLLIITLCFFEKVASHKSCLPFDAIFNFGDSLSDTGNLLASGAHTFLAFGNPPYGKTFFKYPTGRFSDGRLMIDFIAEAYGLPHLPPYLNLTNCKNAHRGVNFAVAGATAIDAEFFSEMGIKGLWTNNSLNIQLGWFKKLKPSLCTTKKDCDNYFKRSLFMVGEIGGNDHNYVAIAKKNISQLVQMVPLVIEAITNAASELIDEGAMNLVVPGNLPVGCSAMYLTAFNSHNKEDYDRHGCLKELNDFAEHYNIQLKLALQTLRHNNPHAKISYADYYGAALRFFHAPVHYGFTGETLKACCGGGGPFNVNISAGCGNIGSKACSDPSTYANWDGIHLTEAAYRVIANGLIEGPFSSPPLSPPPFKIA
ncbi:hypothetical protein Lal_00043895 [Lupinus albus]|nr:hypothetical protein Lal_00043895 [Lupinus albus]